MKAELDFRGVPQAEEEETRAAADLLGRVETKSLSCVADVHAGPWSGGAILARRFPNAEIVSLDPSDLDDRASASARFDLIYFNGDPGLRPSLRKLLPGLVTRLRPGGRLAVQFPKSI